MRAAKKGMMGRPKKIRRRKRAKRPVCGNSTERIGLAAALLDLLAAIAQLIQSIAKARG